jgi:acyl transferase domain-containing protein
VDTACSSSLVAFDIAVSELKENNCQMALVAGVNLILDSRFFITGSAMQAFSKKNRCATFDASADGYCRGEGVGCVLLKRLSQAKVNKTLRIIFPRLYPSTFLTILKYPLILCEFSVAI